MAIEPRNVMFATRRSWLVKLIDFSRAIALDDSPASDDFQSSPPQKPDAKTLNAEWSAPELLAPNGTLSGQVDMWGFGIVAFCL